MPLQHEIVECFKNNSSVLFMSTMAPNRFAVIARRLIHRSAAFMPLASPFAVQNG
jgi:hypothetical protein